MVKSDESEWVQHLGQIVAKHGKQAMPKKIFVIDGKFRDMIPLGPRIVLADNFSEATQILRSSIRKLDEFILAEVYSDNFSNGIQIDHLKEEYRTDNIYCKHF